MAILVVRSSHKPYGQPFTGRATKLLQLRGLFFKHK